METYMKIIIASVIALLLLIVLLIIIHINSKKERKVPLDNEYLEDLSNALGINNINSIDIENKRIRLILKNVSSVDANKLQELKIPAFLKGNELKILVKDHTKEVYDYLSERRNNNE